MPRQKCDSYKVFEKNLERARAFLRVFDIDRTSGRPSNDEQELLRGAVVFAIGALDAFLHDLVLEVVPQFGGNKAALSEALRAIAKDDPSLSLRMALAPDVETREDEFRTALDAWLERKSFQGAGKVSAALTYVGSNLTLGALDANTGVHTAERLQYYTKMRHDMVHRGQRPAVVRSKAAECVDLIAAMAKAINADLVITFYR